MVTIPTTVRDFAEQLDLIQIIDRAISYNPEAYKNIYQIPVIYNYRLRNSAGNATRFQITLHPGLQNANISDLKSTLLHEIAHVLDFMQNHKSGHGAGWWEAMIRLDEKPWITRYHNISTCKKAAQKSNLLENLDF